jgi:hypothetical protein
MGYGHRLGANWRKSKLLEFGMRKGGSGRFAAGMGREEYSDAVGREKEGPRLFRDAGLKNSGQRSAASRKPF